MAQATPEEEAQARQHRISRRRGEKRMREDEDSDDSDESSHRNIPLSAIKGIKKQARYEPVIPMSKNELTKWRKEARRVRNRESAAASRRKTRERIDELEDQVKVLEDKYSAALKRISELETAPPAQVSPAPPASSVSPPLPSVSPPLSPKSVQSSLPQWSLAHQDAASSLAKSTEYENTLLLNVLSSSPSSSLDHHQQPNLMITRPTAVCVNESPLITPLIPSSSEDLGI